MTEDIASSRTASGSHGTASSKGNSEASVVGLQKPEDYIVAMHRAYGFDPDSYEHQLQVIAVNILSMDEPTGMKRSLAIARARKEAANHLVELGYSYRQIMRALGLKSPRSVQYLLSPKTQSKASDSPKPPEPTDEPQTPKGAS